MDHVICFMPYANNKGTDQPVISTTVVRCLDSIISLFSKSKISRLYLVSEAEQAGLGHTLSKTQNTDFLMTWLK